MAKPLKYAEHLCQHSMGAEMEMRYSSEVQRVYRLNECGCLNHTDNAWFKIVALEFIDTICYSYKKKNPYLASSVKQTL